MPGFFSLLYVPIVYYILDLLRVAVAIRVRGAEGSLPLA